MSRHRSGGREATVEQARGGCVGELFDLVRVASARVAVVDPFPAILLIHRERVSTGEVTREVPAGRGGDRILTGEEIEHLATAPSVVRSNERREPSFLSSRRRHRTPGVGATIPWRAYDALDCRIAGNSVPWRREPSGRDRPRTARPRRRATGLRS